MARELRRTIAQWVISKAVLRAARAHSLVVLLLAQAAATDHASALRTGRPRSGVCRARPGRRAGSGIRNRRPVAYSLRSGRRNLANRAEGVARMIHLPASVRVYLCLTPCDMRKSF